MGKLPGGWFCFEFCLLTSDLVFSCLDNITSVFIICYLSSRQNNMITNLVIFTLFGYSVASFGK